MRRAAVAAALAACAGAVALAALPASADSASSVKIDSAYIGPHSITGPTRDHPIPIDPADKTTLSITLTNNGTALVKVRYLRLTGSVLGIHFADYQASASADIDPGQTKTVTSPADFFNVDSVARGYVNGKMEVVDDQRSTVATQSFVADIHGNLASSEGLFLLELVLFALVSLIDIGLGVARRRLPRNRFVCGLLFAFAAASTVLAVVVGAAMAGVALFEPTAWVPALFIATAGAFFLGYISPSQLVRTAPEAAEDRVIDLVAADAVARATGEQERRTTGEVVTHASGDHTGALTDAEAAESHPSGEFKPPSQHDSGGFSPAQPHDSGSHERLE